MPGIVLAAKSSWEINLFSCFQETGGEQFGSNQIKLEEFSGSPVVRTFTAKPTQCSQNTKQNKTKQKSPEICKCFDPEILLRYCSTETFFFFFSNRNFHASAQHICSKMLTYALFVIVKPRKWPKCLLIEWDRPIYTNMQTCHRHNTKWQINLWQYVFLLLIYRDKKMH